MPPFYRRSNGQTVGLYDCSMVATVILHFPTFQRGSDSCTACYFSIAQVQSITTTILYLITPFYGSSNGRTVGFSILHVY
ncbi:hypothetical protein GDO78_002904 [Eleutherodactylus coqui]|uniref:Uncharacterized protein n=1 Tax=Eleutherodactylus coqui TaxID=57060 RepID=A0A8J6K5H6_ELECQ|nr:hypothetical protein GDO78_002904 [Eleutherodactylus coqui]